MFLGYYICDYQIVAIFLLDIFFLIWYKCLFMPWPYLNTLSQIFLKCQADDKLNRSTGRWLSVWSPHTQKW